MVYVSVLLSHSVVSLRVKFCNSYVHNVGGTIVCQNYAGCTVQRGRFYKKKEFQCVLKVERCGFGYFRRFTLCH
jgi:hypothetical protein